MIDDTDTGGGHALPSTRRSIPIALIRAREKVMAPIREMLASTGITEQQWRILRVLEESGPLDASTLADRASLQLPSQTRIVQTLVEKGFVTRQPDDKDRRKQTVAITSDGRRIIDDKLCEAQAIAQRIEETIGKERVALLLDILDDFQKL